MMVALFDKLLDWAMALGLWLLYPRLRSRTGYANPRVRHILIEASWRLPKFQPNYQAITRRRAAIDAATRLGNKAAKKKLTVGLARQFIVDWWRIRTGRTTPEKLGLHMSWPAAYVLRGKAPARVAAPPAATPAT